MRLFVDNLTNVDFSYLCPERGLVGETWLANIELDGTLDTQGMVCDFGIVKKRIRAWLDEKVDHCLLAPELSQQCQSKYSNDDIELTFRFGKSQRLLTCLSPQQAITLIDSTIISPESVAAWCTKHLTELFPSSISTIKLTFTCEPIEKAFYHYSHGLKKHDGNCQRIAHGHRSKILIWRNGVLDEALMQTWANNWQDIYIGTKSDLSSTQESSTHHAFEYEAQQGKFSLSIPKERCYLVDTDTTVELIASHIAKQVKLASPQDSFTVRAFEGIGKGAVVDI